MAAPLRQPVHQRRARTRRSAVLEHLAQRGRGGLRVVRRSRSGRRRPSRRRRSSPARGSRDRRCRRGSPAASASASAGAGPWRRSRRAGRPAGRRGGASMPAVQASEASRRRRATRRRIVDAPGVGVGELSHEPVSSLAKRDDGTMRARRCGTTRSRMTVSSATGCTIFSLRAARCSIRCGRCSVWMLQLQVPVHLLFGGALPAAAVRSDSRSGSTRSAATRSRGESPTSTTPTVAERHISRDARLVHLADDRVVPDVLLDRVLEGFHRVPLRLAGQPCRRRARRRATSRCGPAGCASSSASLGTTGFFVSTCKPVRRRAPAPRIVCLTMRSSSE